MDTGSLPGDQITSIELANSIGALLVSPVCSASCEIKDYVNYLFNTVAGRGSFILPRQNIFAVSCPSYKQELEFLNNQIWIRSSLYL